MGTNTGIGIGIGIPFRNNALGGDNIYFPPELKARMIGVWDNYGKKNTDADRNIIKNKIPNAGGDLEILNAAYKLNSGFGEYKFDFERWALTKPPTTCKKYNDSFNITYVGRPISEGECIVETGNNSDSDIQVYFKVEISGIEDDMEGWFNTANFRNRQQLYNGINIINVTVNSKHWYGFDFIRTDGTALGNCNIVVKQIPAFEGALVTDGINDIIASIKTLEDWNVGNKGITIISMIHQITTNKNFTTTNNLRNEGRVVGRNVVSNTDKTGIYGWYKEDLQGKTATLISNILGDKNDYTGHYTESTNPITNSKFYVQGYAIENGFTELSSVAHYWTFAVLGKATEDEINLIIAKYNLDRTLRPDILCNITKQGITNDNHADFNDKLIDYSGNGRDIQMYNLAWKGGSGVAAKQYETFKDWTSESSSTSIIKQIDEFTRIVESTTNGYWVSRIKRDYDLDKVYDPINVYLYQDNNFLVHECKYEVDGVKYAIPINEPVGKGYHKLEMYTKDRYTELPENAENVVLSEWYFPKSTKGSIKYSIIPSCKGGILLDGINDFGKVTGMPIYKDYTFIIDYERISYASSERWVAGVVSKSHVANQGAFILMTANTTVKSGKQAYSFGGVTSFNRDDFTRALVYQSKYKCGDVDLTVGEGVDSNTLWLGTFRDNDQRFFNGAIYSLMSFPYSMSKFLIERQLKKHKLGTLYPNMVEFRPVIKKDDRIKSIKYYIDGKTANIGQYYPIGTGLGIAVETVQPYMVKSLKVNGVNTIPNADYKGFNARLDSKSPQKITMDIQVDTNLIQWNPIITSTVELTTAPTFAIRGTSTLLKSGDWIPKNSEIWVIVTMNNLIDELRKFSFNGTFINIPSSSYNPDTGKYGFPFVIDNESTQNINLTIDEYIRFEDIVQPYPVLLRFNDENGNEVSWGGKFRVGSTITRIGSAADSNLLPNIYNIFGLLLNDNQVTSSKVIVEKTMVFKAKSAYIFDNNEPNCILSPRLLRIPNSSYKILGYIPDISGHGNHGVIHNSAYGEGSGVNKDGSYQFDGVDDHITIPTVTGGGKQVLMKVNNNTINSMLYDQRSSGASPNSLNSDFAIYNTNTVDNNLIAYQSRLVGKTYIDGILNTNITCEDLLGVLHNITITCDIVAPNNGVVPNIGRGGVLKDLYSKVALYDFMLFDNISTDDKIKELNEYVGIEAKVELPPYYWDAYGKTNLDEDKATIQQRGVAEGDYDITNYNHAYDKMSGYGGYEFAKFDNVLDWYLTPNNNHIDVVSRNGYEITLKNLSTSVYGWYFQNSRVIGFITRDIPFKVKANKSIRVYWDMHSYKISSGEAFGHVVSITTLNPNEDTSISLRHLTEEELVELDTNKDRMYYLLWFDLSTLAVDEEVTIEMLPLYPNGLVYDGVTDYSENANIPAFTDFTYILKRQILKGIANSAVMYKGNITVNQGGAFICNYCEPSDTNLFTDFSFGGLLRSNDIDKPIIYGTKTSVNGDSITSGENIDTVGINVGKWVNYLPMVLYKLILYPKTIPLLQINFLKNLMERDEIIDLDNPIFKK